MRGTRPVALVIVMIAACGTYGGEETPPPPAESPVDGGGEMAKDAGTDSRSTPTDASANDVEASAPSRCNREAPFGEPSRVVELGTAAGENAAWLTPDEHTVYFARASKLLRATRETSDGPYSTAEPVPFVNDDNDGDHPSLTPDELTIVASVNNVLRTSTRTNTMAPFPPLATMPELNPSGAAEGTPTLASGGREIYFRRDVGAHFELLMASRAGTAGAFGAPQLLPINSSSNESNPVVREDGLELWFASTRGQGNDTRIFVATRTTRQEPFGTPVLVAELNTVGTVNVPAWISPDGCVIWIVSNRPGGAGGADLYRAVRPL